MQLQHLAIFSAIMLAGISTAFPREGEVPERVSLLWKRAELPNSVEQVAGPDGEKNGIRWSGNQQESVESVTVEADLTGVDPEDFDEICIPYRTNESGVDVAVRLEGWPDEREFSEWFLKDRDHSGEWRMWRSERAIDDQGELQGAWRKENRPHFSRAFVVRFSRPFSTGSVERFFVELGPVTFIRRPVKVRILKSEVAYEDQEGWWYSRTPLLIENTAAKENIVELELDRSRMSSHEVGFESPGVHQLKRNLAPGAQERVTLVTRIRKATPGESGPLLAEVAGVSFRVNSGEVERPLIGARVEELWVARPPGQPLHFPTPAQTQERIRQMAAQWPTFATRQESAKRAADRLTNETFEIPTDAVHTHQSRYLCPTCGGRLKSIGEGRHQCLRDGTETSDPVIHNAYIPNKHQENLKAAHTLARAYQATGEVSYAQRAAGILTAYADTYGKIRSLSGRSTATGAKLASCTLLEAFVVLPGFDAYELVVAYLDEAQRRKILEGFLLPSARILARHSALLNQQAEHYQFPAAAGLWAGDWNMVAEALYGPFGHFNLLERGFSADGVGLEGGKYGHAQLTIMSRLAGQMQSTGVEILSPKMKALFDAQVALSPDGVVRSACAAAYERVYALTGDARYLPTLASVRAKPNWVSVTDGIASLPDATAKPLASERLEATGYTTLRSRTPEGHLALQINDGMQWERLEWDRSHVKLFFDGRPVSRQIGRINYGSRLSINQYRSWGHNMLVVDGQDAADVRLETSEIVEGPGCTAILLKAKEHPLYDKVEQKRLVAIAGSAFIVIDWAASTKGPRRFDWYFYPEHSQIAFEKEDQFRTVELEPERFAIVPPEGSFGTMRRAVMDGPVRFALPIDGGRPAMKGLLASSAQDASLLVGEVQQHHHPVLHPFLSLSHQGEAVWFAMMFGPATIPDVYLSLRIDTRQSKVWEVTMGEQAFLIGYHDGEKPLEIDGEVFAGPVITKLLTPNK